MSYLSQQPAHTNKLHSKKITSAAVLLFAFGAQNLRYELRLILILAFLFRLLFHITEC